MKGKTTFRGQYLSINLLIGLFTLINGCEYFEDAFGSESGSNDSRSDDICSKSNDRTGNCEPYEAEKYTDQYGTKIANSPTGFTGYGFVDFGGNGTWIEWNNIAAPIAGEYTLTFRYANGSPGNRQTAILVGGQQVGNVPFINTGGWKTWKTTNFKTYLKQGNNTVRIKANAGNGGPNLDNMLVIGENLVQDNCPDDPNKTDPGLCGCGIPEGSCDGSENIALGKPTRQSSIAYRGVSSRAVDGNTSGRYGDGSITHTENETRPWWRVDLGRAYRVQSVTLFNRTDCCSDRLSDFNVDLLDQNDNVIETKYHQTKASTKTDIDIFGAGVYSVRISLRGKNPLSLAEVEVFGIAETDGNDTNNDQCPDDPNKTDPGKCGCGTPETECGTPNVRFLEPKSGNVSANLGVVVDASDSDGMIVEVNLYINNQFVRSEGGAPYEWGTANTNNEDPRLLNLAPGTYELRAEAIDDDGAKGIAIRSVTVSDAGEPGTYIDGPGKIIYPWRATTAVLKGGEIFEVWFDAESNQKVNAVKLRGPFNELNTSIDVELGNWVYDKTSGNRYDTRITVRVPVGSPADRYDLILQTSIGDEISLGSVKVVKDYRREFYVMHFSDTHTFQASSDLSLYKVSTLAEIANILSPELVFITGDNLYFPNDQRVDQFYNGIESKGILGLHDFDAPTFVACGNHDWEQKNDSDSASKAKHYNLYYGLHGYNFTYGKGRFMIINDGWDGNSHHTADAISWLDDIGPGDFRLGAAHIPNGGLSELSNRADLDLILAGHNHYIANNNPHPVSNEPIQYIASSIRDHAPEFNLFRVDVASGTYKTVSGKTAQVVAIENPGDKDKPSLYKPLLTRSFINENDGTSLSNTAVINNGFDFFLPEARVRFVMPLGYEYNVSNGTISQAFDGFYYRIVDVSLKVDARSTTEVHINRI